MSKSNKSSRRGFLGGLSTLLTFSAFEQKVLAESGLKDPTSLESKAPTVVYHLYRNTWNDGYPDEEAYLYGTYATREAAEVAEPRNDH